MTLELKGITKRLGAEVHLHETSLVLEEGSFNTLLGPTLAGKTTLLQLMAGLNKPSSGEIWFAGNNVTGVAVQKRNISIVYQQFINYPNFTVFENIASPLRVQRLDDGEVKQRVHRIAEILRLTPMLERRPHELSGGQQQRTALARALVKDADLVLLDEPLANLDYKLREDLREELPKLFANRHCIVVYATTEPGEALLLGGRTATLFEGRVTQFGDTLALYRRPADLVTARIFSDPPINTASIAKRGDTFHLTGQARWPVDAAYRDLPDGTYMVAIRPHHISTQPMGPQAVAIEGRVIVAELSGSKSIVHFEVEDGIWVSQSPGVHPFKVGERAKLHIDVGHCLYFDQQDRLIAASGAARPVAPGDRSRAPKKLAR